MCCDVLPLALQKECVLEHSDHYMLYQPRVHVPSSHAGANKQEKMAILFEEWCGAGEDWRTSSFLVRIRTKHSAKKRGGRRWMTQEQLATKYNCSQTAQEIVNAKESDPVLKKTQIRPHPELPNRADLRLYLCWDESVESDEQDTVVESLFSMFEDDGGRDSKRAKKSKAATESSESSNESSDTESSASSGKTRKTKTKKKTSKKDKKAKDKKREKDAEKKFKDKEKAKAKEAKKEAQEKKREADKAKNKSPALRGPMQDEITSGHAGTCGDVGKGQIEGLAIMERCLQVAGFSFGVMFIAASQCSIANTLALARQDNG
eukprot:s1799_g9.t1